MDSVVASLLVMYLAPVGALAVLQVAASIMRRL